MVVFVHIEDWKHNAQESTTGNLLPFFMSYNVGISLIGKAGVDLINILQAGTAIVDRQFSRDLAIHLNVASARRTVQGMCVSLGQHSTLCGARSRSAIGRRGRDVIGP